MDLKQDDVKIFKDNIADMPDCAKSYLFQATFEADGHEFRDLTLRVGSVDFQKQQLVITFCEFEDFKVFQTLNEFIRSRKEIKVSIIFYDTKLEKEGYRITIPCKCTYMAPLTLDVSSVERLKVIAEFERLDNQCLLND